jgi:hypothetical protein
VSHQPERTERNCLNCGTGVAGRFCQECGQENIVPKQHFLGMIKHFIYDLFHFDGKFFDTLRYLLFRPGYIPSQYVQGKRMRYLDPIRMYLFTSALFFLVFFSLSDPIFVDTQGTRLMKRDERLAYASVLYQSQPADSITRKQLGFLLDTSFSIILNDSVHKADNDSSFVASINGKNYLMRAEQQLIKPINVNGNPNILSNSVNERWSAYKKRFGDDIEALISDLTDRFLHKLPYILFVSLPFFALILKLLYVRRKEWFYSDHAVFTLYHYIFTFILILLCFLLSQLNDWLDSKILEVFVIIPLVLSGAVYLYFAMKKFYGQGFMKTFFKFLLLNLLAFIVVFLLMIGFFILSVFQL